MRNGHLQFNIKPHAGKRARGASRRARASDILLGMAMMMFIMWLAAYALSHIFAAV